MILTVEELTRRITPVAEKYNLKAVYLFGSYANGSARDDSDVDILIDRTGSTITGIFSLGGLYSDISECIGKEIDLVTTQTLEQSRTQKISPEFITSIKNERVLIYGQP